MSKEELVDAYVKGKITRRVFVRRLVAVGVSIGAAAAYADLLGGARGPTPAARQYGDGYEDGYEDGYA